MKLKNQSIIVTGGASGIGYQAALALAAEGANVIVADFNLDGATKVAAELTQKGVKAFPFKVDVSKAAEVEAMVDFAVEKLGTLNGIFNNAGIGLVKPFLEMDPATYHKVIEVDQHSVYYGMYYAAKKMVALGTKGTFVNTASIYGTTAALGSFNYNAAKAAVIMMTRSAALELAPHGIRVVAVAPGFINTPILGNDAAMKEVAREAAPARKADRARAGGERRGVPLHRRGVGHQRVDDSGGRRLPDLQEQLKGRAP